MAATLSISNDPIAVPRGQLRGRRRVIATVTYSGTFAANADCAVTAANFKLNNIHGIMPMGVTDGFGTIIGSTFDAENSHLLPIMADGAVPTNDNLANCAIKVMVWGD